MKIPSFARHAGLSLLFFAMAWPAFSQTLFEEDFQTRIDEVTGLPVLRCSGTGGAGTYPFPPGWLLRNVDNRTPNAVVAYVNEAWEVREDFSFDVSECAAFSTSWYTPAGASDDWMWTPLIGPIPSAGAILSWRAVTYDPSYPDGYEVRVMPAAVGPPTGGAGTIGNQVINSTVVFSTAAESSTWQTHGVPLDAYAGQSIYIGFRNMSSDKFLLLIDDIKVAGPSTDLALLAPSGFAVPYTRVPAGIAVEAHPQVVVSNQGTQTLSQIEIAAQLRQDGTSFGPPSLATPIPALAPNVTLATGFPAITLTQPGAWSMHFSGVADQSDTDTVPENDEIDLDLTVIGDADWARHDDVVVSILGIGANNGGEIGSSFTLIEPATFEAIRFQMSPTEDATWPGQTLVAYLRATDAAGVPSEVIATTQGAISTAEGGSYLLPFPSGPVALPPGTYVVTVGEPSGGPAMPLAMTGGRFEEGSNWVNWPTAPTGNWANIETFGSTFRVVPKLSLVTEFAWDIFSDGFETAPAPAGHPARLPASNDVSTKHPHGSLSLVDALKPGS